MYEIKVLTDNEFDSLPIEITRGSNISDSLGFADKRTGKAYVRYASHPELQKYLINHELEELEADESTHEDENSIRHKKFWKDFLRPALTFGIVKSEAPLRRAAQTVSNRDVFQGLPEALQPPPAGVPFSGGPLGLFSTQSQATGRAPETSGFTGGLTPQGLFQGTQQQNLPPELLERLKGFVSGRTPERIQF